MTTPEKIIIELTRTEALVLFEFLRRSDDAGNYAFVDQAEQRVLWDLECSLQPQLSEVFDPDYGEILKSAWMAIRAERD
jgi:ABC-type cobalt transport system substrate-binding protein